MGVAWRDHKVIGTNSGAANVMLAEQRFSETNLHVSYVEQKAIFETGKACFDFVAGCVLPCSVSSLLHAFCLDAVRGTLCALYGPFGKMCWPVQL